MHRNNFWQSTLSGCKMGVWHVEKRGDVEKLLQPQVLGAVSVSTADCPTEQRTIIQWYLSIAERSGTQSDGPLCLLKQPQGPAFGKFKTLLKLKLIRID